jgi:Protein of unknown function (DUF1570)
MVKMMANLGWKVISAYARSAAGLIGAAALFTLTAQAQPQPQFQARREGSPLLVIPKDASVPPAAVTSSLLAEANAARDSGAFARADSLYRRAWENPSTRAQASELLQELHHRPGFVLPVDEAKIKATRRELGPEFLRYETAHFVILSDCSADWSRTRGELLEQTRQAFFQIAGKLHVPAYPHPEKLVCVLINDHERYQQFAKTSDGLSASWVAGYYATHSNRVVFYNDATSPTTAAARDRLSSYEKNLRDTRDRADRADHDQQSDLARRLHASADDMAKQIQQEKAELGKHAAACSVAKTIHEATHLLAFNTGLQLPDHDYPFWLSEGLATSFETEDANNAFGPDRSIGTASRRERFETMCREGKLLPLEELIGLGEVPGWDGETAETMYSLGHALFVNLYRTSPQQLGAYIMAISEGPSGQIGRERQVQLFARYFGSVDSVERRLAHSVK